MDGVIGEKQDKDWQAALGRGEIRFQACRGCGTFRHPARWICPECLSEDWDWAEVSGQGTVEYRVRYMQSFDPRGPDAPYDVVIIRLDEGMRLTTNLLDGGPPATGIGERVQISIGQGKDGAAMIVARAIVKEETMG